MFFNFFRELWFEPSSIMGQVLEMYYSIIMLFLIAIFALLVGLFYFFPSKFWTIKIVTRYNMEFVYVFFPTVLLILFLIFSMKALYMSEKMFGELFSFKLTANQWYWSMEVLNQNMDMYLKDADFTYSFHNIDTSNHIFLPINTSILMLVTSQDVIHSVGFPDLGVKVDAVPGRLNSLEFIGFNIGVVSGYCTELCGAMHSSMPFQVEFLL